MDQRGAESIQPFRFIFFPRGTTFLRIDQNASLQSSIRKLQYPSYKKTRILTKPTEDEYDNGYSGTSLHVEEQSSTSYPVTQLLEKQFTRSSRALNRIWCTEEDRGEKEERIQNDFTDEQGYYYDYHEESYLDGEEGTRFCSDEECALAAGTTINKSPRGRKTHQGSPNDKHQQIVCGSLNNEDKIENKEQHKSRNIKVETSLPMSTSFEENQFTELPEVTVKEFSSKTETNSKSDIHHKSSDRLVELPSEHSSNISIRGRTELNKVAERSTEETAKIHLHESISKNSDTKVKEMPKCSAGRRIHENKGEQENSQIDSEDLCTDHPTHSVDAEAFGSVDEEYYSDGAYGKDNIPTDKQGDGGRYSYGIRQYLNMPTFMKSIRKFALANQFELKDVAPDGNCMFKAIEDQLNINGDLGYTPKILRETAVRYLRNNPCQSDGCRLEAFLHTESWEEYLTRMNESYQWGDHMTLKALADALNLTVVVFNVYEDDVRRTEIPSEGNPVTRRQRLTVFLGHIGEFHYLSLRPAEWEKQWAYKSLIRRRQVNCQTEDLGKLTKWLEENIGMEEAKTLEVNSEHTSPKKENALIVPDNSKHYVRFALQHQMLQLEDSEESRRALIDDPFSVDGVTGLTLPHFSFILNFVLHRFDTFISKTYFRMDDFQIISGENVLDTLIYGTAVDGTNVYVVKKFKQGWKMQYEIEKKASYRPTLITTSPDCAIVFSENDKQFPEVYKVYAEEHETHPGYCRLKPDQIFERIWNDFSTESESEKYLKAEDIPEYVRNFVEARGISKMFYGYKCSTFPLSVRKKWKSTEKNTSHWPSAQVKQKVISSRCFVVQKSHPTSRMPEREWKYVFAEGEKLLLKEGLTLCQRKIFSVFKVLVEYTTRYSQRRLKNKHIKNVFFYACENIPEEVWEANVGGCLIYLLAYLFNRLRKRNIPHYFIAKNNLLDYYSDGEVKELCINIEALRVFPVHFLEHLFDAYGWESVLTSRLCVLQDCEHFARTRDINHCWMNVFIPAIIQGIQEVVKLHWFEIAYTSLKLAYEEVLLAPITSDRPSFPDFFLKTLSTLEDITHKRGLAKFYNQDFGTDILAGSKNETVLVRDIVSCEVDERIGCLEVPKYCTHNMLDLAQWLDDKAYIYVCRGEHKMAKNLVLAAISCAKGLLKEHIGFEINDIADENLKAEIKQQKLVYSSSVLPSLRGMYSHLIFLHDSENLQKELRDLETYRASVPIIGGIIEYIKSYLTGSGKTNHTYVPFIYNME